MPMVAFTPESSERPMHKARFPGTGSARAADPDPVQSVFRTARSVPGSVPTSVAGAFLPSGSVTLISSSRRIVCSAETMTPGLQKTPLEENRGRACTATAARPACSTAAASSFESAANSFAIGKPP